MSVWVRAGVYGSDGRSDQPGLDDESGRGLMLVEAVAERWGWDSPATGRGKIVWALVES